MDFATDDYTKWLEKNEPWMLKPPRMVGYHYTSLENYRQIQKHGLEPYKIRKPELEPYNWTGTVKGVWVWQQDLTDVSEAGTVIFQATSKNTTEVVKLRVEFDGSDRLRGGESALTALHKGSLGDDVVYHTHEPAWIVLKKIPSKNITLVKTFDLLKLYGIQEAPVEPFDTDFILRAYYGKLYIASRYVGTFDTTTETLQAALSNLTTAISEDDLQLAV
jgi:hypothetical protein